MDNDEMMFLNFENQNLPKPYESKNRGDSNYVQFGYDNLYPNYLIDLYMHSPTHCSIINQKVVFVQGGGLSDSKGNKIDINVNAADSLEEFVKKISYDWLIHSRYAVEVIMDSNNKPIQFYHVPVHRVRPNNNKTKFWVVDTDWAISRKTIIYDRYSHVTNSDSTSKIFYVDNCGVAINSVYSLPSYLSAENAIKSDWLLGEYTLNNIANHFSPSTHITYFRNAVGREEQEKIAADIKKNFKGVNGNKYILGFESKDGKAPQIDKLSAGDWDKQFTESKSKVIDDIMMAENVTSPALYAISIPGKLGNDQNKESDFQTHMATHIQVIQNEILNSLNQLFKGSSIITDKLSFIPINLFNKKISDTILEKILTKNELRLIAGYEERSDCDIFIQQPSPAVAATLVAQPAEPPVVDEKKKSLTESDFELIKHYGVSAEDFDILGEHDEHQHEHFDLASDIAEYVISNDIKDMKVDEVIGEMNKAGINVDANELDKIFKQLTESGLVKIDIGNNNRITIKPLPAPEVDDTKKVQIMYQYIKRPEISGPDLLPTSRGFCVKLIENNRLYTRQEIQDMSAIFNYSIFDFGGGFYYNPDTNTTTSHCRHKFKTLRVSKRN